MKTINDINTTTIEGKLLLSALAQITTESQTDKTPDEVLFQVVERAKFMFKQEDEVPLEKLHTESSQIARTKYLAGQEILEVEFKSNGKVYHYAGVGFELWVKACSSESIGAFINKEIKPYYDYKLVGEMEFTDAPKKVAYETKTTDTGGL